MDDGSGSKIRCSCGCHEETVHEKVNGEWS